jgi:NADH:ubiquinone oxidoreductase subunit F (NADH-binding)/NADH:ubiquinone oxidoreductase subunit E/NAD-dependent dihydropyrimidine dehydrogenase PreA subunit
MGLAMHHDLARVEEILQRYPRQESSLVMILQDIQRSFAYLPCEALERVAAALAVPSGRVFSVATFYKAFSLEPQGRTVIHVCKGTACHVRGAQLLEDELSRILDVPPGGTTPDGAFTLRTVNCVGACAMAPVVVSGEQYHGEMRPSQLERLIRRGRRAQAAPGAAAEAPPAPVAEATAAAPAAPAAFADPEAVLARSRELAALGERLTGRILVCGGPGCLAAGAREVHGELLTAAAAAGLAVRVELAPCDHASGQGNGGRLAEAPERLLSLTGCQGLCQQGPLVRIEPEDLLYTHVKPQDAGAIIEGVRVGEPVSRLLGESRGRREHPFHAGQQPRALAYCGHADPESLDDYLSRGGFLALAQALARGEPEVVLAEVEASGLRGRGGAGFPTGRKWRTAVRAAAAAGVPPYVLCNGDEGDPGAFMDRALMEGAPFQVIEGLVLGAWALGAHEGYIYVRAEYPLAVERLERAIAVCRRAGLLGEHILGRDFSFELRISRGGGAFVCGESTALMRSLEGKVGEPRAKYVRSVERGLHDRPTVLNNVETWALVPGIVRHGAGWLADLGTERSRGTKVFSLVGQVQRSGLVEVPMGTTLRQLIFEIGGGVAPGRIFKAVQTGGPSGGCLPEPQLDLPIDFEALDAAGSMMGSGGMIVMDDRTCMVDVASYFVDFLRQESCGKCVPCRLGLGQVSELLAKVKRGAAVAADLAAIEDICLGMAESSLCGLGKSAPNPVLSTLRYFREEYEAHLAGRCPALVCKDLIRYEIDETCEGCMACVKRCPTGAISGQKEQRHTIDADLCTRCGICRAVCPTDSVVVLSGEAT